MSKVAMVVTGKMASITKEKLQPLENAKANPEIVIEKAQMIVLNFSPKA
jgi:hypothetical protein